MRARAGVSFDRALRYVTGGVAYANMNTRMSWGNAWAENWNTGRTGWTLGAGAEYAFTPNWIGRVEYRFSQFGNFSRFSPLAGYTISQRVNDNAVRVGVAYKFGAAIRRLSSPGTELIADRVRHMEPAHQRGSFCLRTRLATGVRP